MARKSTGTVERQKVREPDVSETNDVRRKPKKIMGGVYLTKSDLAAVDRLAKEDDDVSRSQWLRSIVMHEIKQRIPNHVS